MFPIRMVVAFDDGFWEFLSRREPKPPYYFDSLQAWAYSLGWRLHQHLLETQEK